MSHDDLEQYPGELAGADDETIVRRKRAIAKMSARDDYVRQMTAHFLVTEVWTGLDWDDRDEDDNPTLLDYRYTADDFTESALEQATDECGSFYDENEADLVDMDPEQAGHDFSLTRNGHGAGFWDRGLGDRGERLADAARAFGETNVFVTDDGKLDFG